MSIVVNGGRRGLTDPEISKVIMAAIPDQPLETQRKMNYFMTPRGKRINEYEVLCCYYTTHTRLDSRWFGLG